MAHTCTWHGVVQQGTGFLGSNEFAANDIIGSGRIRLYFGALHKGYLFE